ncbi:MAG: hypothetical protein ABSH23_01155 [Steroidobacteraceae bacterium]
MVLLNQDRIDLRCGPTADAGLPHLPGINHGTGWVLFEQASKRPAGALLSILSPRRPARNVAAYLEQLYVDRFCAIRAQLIYKKSRKYAAWPTRIDRYGLGMRCGHDPCFIGIYARRIVLMGDILEIEYKVVEVADNPRHLTFQTKRQSLTVNV